jgi:putative ATP-dependent endonuclease of OLD family
MRITTLKVTNHSAIPDIEIEVREHLVLVGPNESGKTSLLRLLDAVLRGTTGALYSLIDEAALRDASQPLSVEVLFADFSDDDKAAFPDEIEVHADGSLSLKLLLRATHDPATASVAIERLFLKPGLQLPVTAAHLANVGWVFLPANRSPDRELGVGRTSAMRALLGTIDLGDSLAQIVKAIEDLHEAVHDAPALQRLREGLAVALADLLPYEVTSDDLSLALPRADETDPLADVDVKLASGGSPRSLREQSDGMRAMSTVAIQLMARQAENIVAVDEPEVHLHPRAQARIGAMLRDKATQSVIATHSPAVLTQFSPMHAVALVGGRCRQLQTEPFAADPKSAEHWWTTPALEPLTSRGVVLVEGVADRVMVEGVARAQGIDLDRLGVVVAAVNGAGGFKMSLALFGASGFDIPLAGLVDLKEANDVATYLRIAVADVPSAGFTVCSPDLEGDCVSRLGAEAHARLLIASGLFREAQVLSANKVSSLGDLSDAVYAEWCRANKTLVAPALASAMSASDAAQLAPLVAVIALIANKLTS